MKRTAAAFTIIELMLAMTATLFIVATFFRVFNHTARVESNSNLKTNVAVKGEHILNMLENSMRLIGLANTNADLTAGAIIPTAVGIAQPVTAGNFLTGSFTFTYLSPYGGPVTKVLTATGNTPGCSLTVLNSNALTSNTSKLTLINKKNVYLAAVTNINNNAFVVSSATPTLESGALCADVFLPGATLVTGANRTYTLSFNGNEISLAYLEDTTNKIAFTYPKDEMPFFVLQFFTEAIVNNADGTITTTRVWTHAPTDKTTIKAVRFGFVLTSREARIDKAPVPNSFTYCLFDDTTCFTAPTNTGKRYVAFSRTVHIKNYDFLKDHLLPVAP